MTGLRALGLAGCMSILAAGSAGAETETAPLRLAQGFDINELLKGAEPQPEAHSPAPTDPTDLLRGTPRPAPTVEADMALAPRPQVRAFPDTALAGRWIGIGPHCTEKSITFVADNTRFTGTSIRTDPVDGFTETTLFDAGFLEALQGEAHPEDPGAFLSFARLFEARITRRGPEGEVLNMLEDWPVHLLIARDSSGQGFVLRFVEPVTICAYRRPATTSSVGRED